jgi:tRNA (adenine57-N1/adenine58-N1)-methyltransferase catalytic subunit
VKPRRGPFQPGDHVQLRGPKGKLHTITLTSGGNFHTHKGVLSHDDLIGQPEGAVVTSSNGSAYLALRPLLGDFVLSMARGAAIIYPKDSAHLVSLVDIAPGHHVVEAGVGSGALTLSLLRAVGESGSVVSIERRVEFAEIAQANIEAFHGMKPTNWSCMTGNFEDRIFELEAHSVDRIILDMLAPWECIEGVLHALQPGGVLGIYVATVTQLSRVQEAIRATQRFTSLLAQEVIVRPWHVEGLAVRPEHRMIGHTGFLVSARIVPEGVTIPAIKTHHQKPEYSVEDVEAWTPGATGQRVANNKTVRKKVREAKARAERSLAPPDDVGSVD